MDTDNTSHITGLSPRQVEQSRAAHGANIITPPPRPSLWRKFMGYFDNPLIKILLVALVLSIAIAIYEFSATRATANVFLEPLGILIAILLATLIGFWLEVSADRKFEILNKVNDDLLVKVMREGRVTEIPRRDVVVGDIVILETGDEVPADGHLVDSLAMGVNESSLTGEPLAHKSHRPDDVTDHDATYPADMVMRGTTVVEGRGLMQVTAVGDHTEQGHVFKASTIDTGIKTPLTLQFERLGRLISYASYAIGALIVIGRCMMFDWAAVDTIDAIEYALTTIMLAVTLIVVSVPEGLPMSVTLSLALSMRRMLATNNLVRKMHACETMGATTVICTDKTGTLTQNRMSVADTRFYGLADGHSLTDDRASHAITEGIAVNSTAFLDYGDDPASPHPTVVGNPTEGALLLWLYSQGVDYLKLREDAAVVAQLPFSTRRKYMATVVDSPLLGCRMLYVKGAPEIVMGMCADMTGGATPDAVNATLLDWQSHARRTLGFACCRIDSDAPVIVDDKLRDGLPLEFTGICAIADPVRAEVPRAIRDSLHAGIDVKIVTGDTPGTAKEIGRQVGLWTDTDTDRAHISGPDWAALSDEEALARAREIKIMSRARPTDKSRLVSLLQKQGEVVAVTGDGTNDAPALNAAQVGLAMGDGTSVAKEAGDIIIMDNSFASIAKAVMWGRSLYLNIQRFVLFQLTVNIVACLIVVIGAFSGTQSPLTVTQMLWVNLIMDTFAALSLASLPPSDEVMNRPPRRSGAFIITPSMGWRIIGLGLLFTAILWVVLQYLRVHVGDSIEAFDFGDFMASFITKDAPPLSAYDLTVFFCLFVFIQVWNLFNARAFESGHSAFHDMRDSKVFFAVVAIIFAGQFAIVYLGGEMFNVVPLPLDHMLLIVAITSPIMLIPLVYDLIKHIGD
ncbi:MAG: calcium-translocating P-type ATPase, PMCA-type [Bacteroidales bacterium]|nr:calcium-translocating P-type ATPase, PMCA-type [Bacteroidales bacterium]